MTSACPALAWRDVHVTYGGRAALRGVEASVEQGELLAVLGANGSGKSTLVRAALGLVPLARGSVEVFGKPLHEFGESARIGYVPQRVGATAGVPATVREVVASGRLARMRRGARSRAADRDAVARALGAVGLQDRASDSVASLSGGQQQRVLVARALAGEPELLVLDEPTAGVDLEVQAALADVFGALVGAGTCVVLVAHELGPVQPLVQRALVLRAGQVVHDGPPPSLHHLHELDPEHAHPPHDEHAHHDHATTGWTPA